MHKHSRLVKLVNNAQIQTLDAVSEQLVWILHGFFITHFFTVIRRREVNLAEITENNLSVSESGLLSFSIPSSTADVIWDFKSERDIPRRIAGKFVLYVRECHHVKYPVQIPVPSDLTIIAGDSVSEELERRYKTCKEKKVDFFRFYMLFPNKL